MKILILSKRQYTNKDLIEDRYGRIRELALALANFGHLVEGMCLSYERKEEGQFFDKDEKTGNCVSWCSFNAGMSKIFAFRRFRKEALKKIREKNHDIIYASSDTVYAILGVELAEKTGSTSVVDLYDNYEAFASAKIPGLLFFYRRAVVKASGLVVISNGLQQKVVAEYGREKPTATIVNGIPENVFIPLNKIDCRNRFGLSLNAQIIGTAGAISRSRGADIILRAFERMSQKDPNLHLVLAGALDGSIVIENHPRIHYLGALPFTEIPKVINALDVAIISNVDSPFGRYCFPQKSYEIIACRRPLVASAVGSMRELLKKYPECLFKPEDETSLADALKKQLINPTAIEIRPPTWPELGRRLESLFNKIVEN